MRIFARNTLIGYWETYPIAEQPIKAWFKIAKNAKWKSHNELKAQMRNASFINEKRVVFNIKGNDFRLVVDIEYKFGFIFVVWFVTHSEYSKLDIKELSYD